MQSESGTDGTRPFLALRIEDWTGSGESHLERLTKMQLVCMWKVL
jgi:hypothetical protein